MKSRRRSSRARSAPGKVGKDLSVFVVCNVCGCLSVQNAVCSNSIICNLEELSIVLVEGRYISYWCPLQYSSCRPRRSLFHHPARLIYSTVVMLRCAAAALAMLCLLSRMLSLLLLGRTLVCSSSGSSGMSFVIHAIVDIFKYRR